MSGGIEQAARLIGRATRGLVLTGAGVSQESGIRTFRGEDGLWKEYDPVKVSSIEYFLRDPAAYWTVSRDRGRTALAARPNPGHLALAELERMGHVRAVVTQNTDGLHLDAGSQKVIELHGSGRRVRCLDCGQEETRASVQQRLHTELPPRCQACGGGLLKPTVVLFGEPLPAAAIAEANRLARDCDLILVVGSSLQVWPAAQLPVLAVTHGAPLVIVNAEPTEFDADADVVVHGRSGEVLPEVVSLIQRAKHDDFAN